VYACTRDYYYCYYYVACDDAYYRHVPSMAVDDDDADVVDNASSLRDTASSEQRLPSVATVCQRSLVLTAE